MRMENGKRKNNMSESDKCYDILGLKTGATDDQIKQAYRDLVRVWHPDRFAHDPKLQGKAQEKLKEINAAYEQLMNAGTRSGYSQRQSGSSSTAQNYQTNPSESPNQQQRKESTSPSQRRPSRWRGIIYTIIGIIIIRLWASGIGNAIRSSSSGHPTYAVPANQFQPQQPPESSVSFGRTSNQETLRDSTSGLMWSSKASAYAMNQDQAVQYIRNLSLGGVADWRLPTRAELESIKGSSIWSMLSFPPDGAILSATNVPDQPYDHYWVMRIQNGHVYNGYGEKVYVLAVRNA